MAAISKKVLKKRFNISLDIKLQEQAMKYAKERYNTSLSALITAQLEDFVSVEKRKKEDHVDQGSLL